MNEIIILSGKGGTGKTSISAAFTTLNQNIIVADCDVDAANLHLIMQPENFVEEPFSAGKKAQVNNDLCTLCEKCIEYCRFDAISIIDDRLQISQISCDGCKLCVRVCPADALSMIENNKSRLYIGKVRTGTMVHARLSPGEDNSGKLVALVKKKAREIAKEKTISTILVDGPPGIGCPVIASISGADKIVLVTEPTISGISDLVRIIKLLKNFKGQKYIIVNKADINESYTKKIAELANEEKVIFLGKIPYNKIFTDAMVNCQSITEYEPSSEISEIIRKFWKEIIEN
jgi:MinD superfamily P-loop ATPase